MGSTGVHGVHQATSNREDLIKAEAICGAPPWPTWRAQALSHGSGSHPNQMPTPSPSQRQCLHISQHLNHRPLSHSARGNQGTPSDTHMLVPQGVPGRGQPGGLGGLHCLLAPPSSLGTTCCSNYTSQEKQCFTLKPWGRKKGGTTGFIFLIAKHRILPSSGSGGKGESTWVPLRVTA